MKLALAILIMLCLSGMAMAQQPTYPKAEVFGGYNFTYFNSNASMDGWLAAVTGNFSPLFGVTMELAGVYGKERIETVLKTRASMHSFMAGPQFTARRGVFAINAHMLAGVARLGAGIDFLGARLDVGETHFIMAIGPGINIGGPSRRIGGRAQFDYLPIAANGFGGHVRVSSGIVVRF